MVESGNEIRREGVNVNLEAHGESGSRADAGANAAKLSAFDGLMKHERAAPKRFVSKRIETKRPAALGN